MKKYSLLILIQILLVIVLSGLTPAFASPIVSIQPSSLSVPLGNSFTLDVSIADVADLYALQFDITFDPTIISALSITEGSFLLGGGSTFFIPGDINNNVGTISFTGDTLIGGISGVTGSGVLATLNFQSLAVGTSPIELMNVILLDSNFFDISFTTANASINVAPVPLPTAFWLLGAGLIGLIGFRKKLYSQRNT